MIHYKVKHDCFCEGYLHEMLRYYREGLKEKKLIAGDIVEHIEDWSNMYGSYIRVKKDDVIYDMLNKNLEML